MIEHFHRPASVREALALKRRLRTRAAFLAGGTFLNSGDFGGDATQVIALEGLGLDKVESKSGRVVIGACATLQALLDDRRVPATLKAGIAQIVHRHIRNAATIGGHVAAPMPQSDLVPMLIALDARVVVAGAGAARALPLAKYVAKPVPGLVTRIELPKPPAGRVAACRNLRESANARSIVSVAVSATLARGIVRDPIVAVAGVARTAIRVTAAERAIHGKPLPEPDALQALVSAAVKPVAMDSASVAMRRFSAGSLVALAFAAATKGGRR